MCTLHAATSRSNDSGAIPARTVSQIDTVWLPEAVEGALEQVVVAVVGHPAATLAKAGAGERAGRQRQAVHQPERIAGRQALPQALLDQLLDPPKVGSLTSEGGAADLGEGRELVAVVAAEGADEGLVGVQVPELADEFDGDDPAIGQGRLRTAGAEAARVQGLQFVVHETE